MRSGYSLDIADDEQWQEARDGVTRFVTTALEEWNPAPPSGTGNFHERVWSYVRDVPLGTVVTYGQVAEILGSPEAAQAVGNAMRALPDETDVPWHRVVTAQGRLAANEPQEHRRRLRKKGSASVRDDSVDLEERSGASESCRRDASLPASRMSRHPARRRAGDQRSRIELGTGGSAPCRYNRRRLQGLAPHPRAMFVSTKVRLPR